MREAIDVADVIRACLGRGIALINDRFPPDDYDLAAREGSTR
jgi:hypothetical protein